MCFLSSASHFTTSGISPEQARTSGESHSTATSPIAFQQPHKQQTIDLFAAVLRLYESYDLIACPLLLVIFNQPCLELFTVPCRHKTPHINTYVDLHNRVYTTWIPIWRMLAERLSHRGYPPLRSQLLYPLLTGGLRV
jgi:hypothetical protein